MKFSCKIENILLLSFLESLLSLSVEGKDPIVVHCFSSPVFWLLLFLNFIFSLSFYSIWYKFNHCLSSTLSICWLRLREQNQSNNRDTLVIPKLEWIRLESNLPQRWKEVWIPTQILSFWQLSTRTIPNEACIRFIIKTGDILIRKFDQDFHTQINKSLKFSLKLLLLVHLAYKDDFSIE